MLVCRIRTESGPAGLCDSLGRLDAVAVRIGAAGSLEEFELASHLAGRAFGKKSNIANRPAYEFMLWLAGKTDIRSAMEELSPKEGENEFFVVVFSGREKGEVLRELGAGELPLGLPQRGEALALERISLSRT